MVAAAFSTRHFYAGTSTPRYGLTVREAEAGDAPRFLARLRAGETAAFEELVITYQHRVFGVALRMLGNAAEAQEVAQEAFLRAHRGLAEFRGDAKLSTWLYAITSRLCLTRLSSFSRLSFIVVPEQMCNRYSIANKDVDFVRAIFAVEQYVPYSCQRQENRKPP